MDKKIRILVLCAVILFLWFVGSASAKTLSVDCSGGANFTRIQDTIDNSSDGDTILVYTYVYSENVVVNKLVTLRGIGQPVVDAGGSGSSITLTADGITLEGFNVTNAERSYVIPVEVEYGAGINVISSNNIITSNTVSNNECDIVLIYSGNNNTITGNTFANGGLIVYESNQNTVENNTVNGKPLVYLEDVSNYKVEDAGQVVLVNCSNIIVKNQDLSNVAIGIALWKTEDSTISNNKVCNNFIINSTDNFSECAGAIEEAVKKAIEVIMGERKEEVNEEIGKEVGKTKEQPKNPVNSASPNTWNSTKEIRYIYNGTTHQGYLGNYWSDYEEKYPDAEEIDTTGIWDMPYRIDEAKDNYPLMERFENYINP